MFQVMLNISSREVTVSPTQCLESGRLIVRL